MGVNLLMREGKADLNHSNSRQQQITVFWMSYYVETWTECLGEFIVLVCLFQDTRHTKMNVQSQSVWRRGFGSCLIQREMQFVVLKLVIKSQYIMESIYQIPYLCCCFLVRLHKPVYWPNPNHYLQIQVNNNFSYTQAMTTDYTDDPLLLITEWAVQVKTTIDWCCFWILYKNTSALCTHCLWFNSAATPHPLPGNKSS